MKDIIEAKDLPEEEKVYLKKDIFGWRTVEPLKIDGKINWFNLLLGGKRGLAFTIFAMIIIGLLYLGIDEIVSGMRDIAENPCAYCSYCTSNVEYDERVNNLRLNPNSFYGVDNG